jgi:Mitochondrial biogenesis AIM24/Peptidase family M48
MALDVVDFEIFGDDMQYVEIELDPGEAAIGEAGAMMMMQDGVEMDTVFGDGSAQQGGLFGKLMGAGKRLVTRESLFTTIFHNESKGKRRVAFAAPYPGKIIPVQLTEVGGALICQKDSQHVEQRHSLQAVIKDLGLRGLWLLATGDAGGGLTGRAALELTALTLSRDAELQADARAFDTLVCNGVDPDGLREFFCLLTQHEGAAPPAFLSTHPASADRERALRARAAEVSTRRFEPLQFGAWPP